MSWSAKWLPPTSKPLEARDYVSSLSLIESREASSKAFELAGKRVFVAGHTGMAGSAIVRRLGQEGCNLLLPKRSELDLTRQDQTERYLSTTRPEVVIMAAGRVGGILANDKNPANFLADNLAMALNCIHVSHVVGVKKLLFLGSSCIYPKFAKQPMSEDQLLTGPLEPTNESYAIAKIAGIKLCEAYRRQYDCDFISVMPTNLYGPGDNYHPEHSHVVAALIRRFHEAKINNAPTVVVWGTGTPRREFLYVDDFADACVFVLKNYSVLQFINIGVGEDITIAEFAQTVAEVVGFHGNITYDASRPDGMPRKLLDVSRLSALGWKARTSLRDGLKKAYNDFLTNAMRER
jgi:GDP-L-fucose synthase